MECGCIACVRAWSGSTIDASCQSTPPYPTASRCIHQACARMTISNLDARWAYKCFRSSTTDPQPQPGTHPVLPTPPSRLPLTFLARRHVRCHAPLPGAPRHRGLRHPHLQGAFRSAYRASRWWRHPPVAAQAGPRVRPHRPGRRPR